MRGRETYDNRADLRENLRFEDGGRGPLPRPKAASRNWKHQGNGGSSGDSRRKAALPTLQFWSCIIQFGHLTSRTVKE